MQYNGVIQENRRKSQNNILIQNVTRNGMTGLPNAIEDKVISK